MIVVDASSVLGWLLDEVDDAGEGLTRVRLERATAPAILPFEVLNGIEMAVRRGRIARTDVGAMIEFFYDIGIEFESAPARDVANRIESLAVSQGITAYDAAYLELALRSSTALATRDRKLASAAAAAGIAVL